MNSKVIHSKIKHF